VGLTAQQRERLRIADELVSELRAQGLPRSVPGVLPAQMRNFRALAREMLDVLPLSLAFAWDGVAESQSGGVESPAGVAVRRAAARFSTGALQRYLLSGLVDLTGPARVAREAWLVTGATAAERLWARLNPELAQAAARKREEYLRHQEDKAREVRRKVEESNRARRATQAAKATEGGGVSGATWLAVAAVAGLAWGLRRQLNGS